MNDSGFSVSRDDSVSVTSSSTLVPYADYERESLVRQLAATTIDENSHQRCDVAQSDDINSVNSNKTLRNSDNEVGSYVERNLVETIVDNRCRRDEPVEVDVKTSPSAENKRSVLSDCFNDGWSTVTTAAAAAAASSRRSSSRGDWSAVNDSLLRLSVAQRIESECSTMSDRSASRAPCTPRRRQRRRQLAERATAGVPQLMLESKPSRVERWLADSSRYQPALVAATGRAAATNTKRRRERAPKLAARRSKWLKTSKPSLSTDVVDQTARLTSLSDSSFSFNEENIHFADLDPRTGDFEHDTLSHVNVPSSTHRSQSTELSDVTANDSNIETLSPSCGVTTLGFLRLLMDQKTASSRSNASHASASSCRVTSAALEHCAQTSGAVAAADHRQRRVGNCSVNCDQSHISLNNSGQSEAGAPSPAAVELETRTRRRSGSIQINPKLLQTLLLTSTGYTPNDSNASAASDVTIAIDPLQLAERYAKTRDHCSTSVASSSMSSSSAQHGHHRHVTNHDLAAPALMTSRYSLLSDCEMLNALLLATLEFNAKFGDSPEISGLFDDVRCNAKQRVVFNIGHRRTSAKVSTRYGSIGYGLPQYKLFNRLRDEVCGRTTSTVLELAVTVLCQS